MYEESAAGCQLADRKAEKGKIQMLLALTAGELVGGILVAIGVFVFFLAYAIVQNKAVDNDTFNDKKERR